MKVVCSEDQVQMTDTVQKPLALLLGNAPTNTDDQVVVFLLELLESSQGTINLVFWFCPDATGVEQDDVGPMDIVGGPVIVFR